MNWVELTHYKFEAHYRRSGNRLTRESLKQQLKMETKWQRQIRRRTLSFRRRLYPILEKELGKGAIYQTIANKTLFTVMLNTRIRRSEFEHWVEDSLRLAALCVRYEHRIQLVVPAKSRTPRFWIVPLK